MVVLYVCVCDLGYIRMRLIGTGKCLASAVVTTFFYDGGTAYVPGVAANDAVALNGNNLKKR